MFFDERVFQYIFTIAREKNISKAAEKLYVSQPTLSKFLSNVEKKLDAKIFDRSKKTLTITPAGLKYLEYLHKVESLNKEYTLAIKAEGLGEKTTLRVGCGSITSPLLSRYVFPQLQRLHPQVRITLIEDVHYKLLQMFKNKSLDIAVLVGQANNEPYFPEAQQAVVAKGSRLLAVAAEHPLARLIKNPQDNSVSNPTKIKPKDLNGQVLIAGMPGQKQYEDLRIMEKKYGLMGVELVSTKNVLTGISMAACNLGAYFFPGYYFDKFAVADKLLYLSLDIEEAYWSLVLEYRTEHKDMSIIEDFVHIAQARMGY